eukprot:SAG22_NODE_1228_length_5083_cov_2.820425_2_plen_779_part_00
MLAAGTLGLLLAGRAAAAAATPALDLSVSKDGSFVIAMDGAPWLKGGEVQAGGLSSSAGTLVPSGAPAKTTGTDKLGAYSATTLQWAKKGAPQSAGALMTTSFRTYAADPSTIVFEQLFPAGLAGQAAANVALPAGVYDRDAPDAAWRPGGAKDGAQTIFPGFSRSSPGHDAPLPCFAYHGVFPQMYDATLATYKESHMGGVPLVIYDPSNASLPMTVFSPLNQPMAHHMGSGDSYFGAGVKASVDTIPPGWSQLFILSAGAGINAGMMAWGDTMLKYTGKPRADMYRDLTHSTIGFWTDNGGYYHYATGEKPCKAGDCPSYETVLPKVKAYHDSLGVPFRHWQFDSWFYPKDGGVNAGGGGGAVTNWTADPGIFPAGMVAIQDKLKVPTVMHNRQWSKISDYVKSGCQAGMAGTAPDAEHCMWYKSEKAAVPTDPINFFTWFFTQQDGWGLSMYEQDWMCTEYDEVEVLQTNISMGDLWLEGMATGAASSNRTVQYCMPYANQVLSAAAYPAVTNARATGDYFHAENQWAVGGTSLFYWAIGILPFKDGFYSSTNRQVGGQTVGPERQPDREALMATLSCAMVGPMDGINLLNASRSVTPARTDGYILKPDKPVSTADSCFTAKRAGEHGPAGCYIYHTYSDKGAAGMVHYHFASPGGPMLAADVYLTGSEEYVVYNWYSGELHALAASVDLAPGYEGNTYAVVSPVHGGWAFVGEVDKYVPASTLRFPKVEVSSGLAVTVSGLAGETVKVCAANKLKLVCKSVAFTAMADKTVSFP